MCIKVNARCCKSKPLAASLRPASQHKAEALACVARASSCGRVESAGQSAAGGSVADLAPLAFAAPSLPDSTLIARDPGPDRKSADIPARGDVDHSTSREVPAPEAFDAMRADPASARDRAGAVSRRRYRASVARHHPPTLRPLCVTLERDARSLRGCRHPSVVSKAVLFGARGSQRAFSTVVDNDFTIAP